MGRSDAGRHLETVKRIALQAAIIAPFFIVSPAIWNACQPAASIALVLSGAALIWSSHELETNAIILAGAALAVSVLVMPHNGRGAGYYHNPNLAGAALAMLLMLAIQRRSWCYAAIIGAGLLATVSIGAIIGAVAGLVAFSGAILRWIGQHKHIAAIALILAVLVGVAGFSLVATGRHWWSTRPILWRQAITLIRADPLTGAGPGGYHLTQFVWSFYPGDSGWSRISPKIHPHAHNIYLHIGADYGLIALAAVLAAALVVYRHSNQAARATLIVSPARTNPTTKALVADDD